MKASAYLSVSVSGNAATLAIPFHPGHLMVLAASCATSIERNIPCQQLSISVNTGEDAVVIIKQRRGKEKMGFDLFTYIISVTWSGSKMCVELDSPYVPHPDRLLAVDDNDMISVVTDGQRFVFKDRKTVDDDTEWQKKKFRVVNNPEILCRFALQQASLEDLIASATLDMRGQVERDLQQLREQHAALLKKFDDAEQAHRRFVQATNNDLEVKTRLLNEELAKSSQLESTIKILKTFISRVRSVLLEKYFWNRQTVTEIEEKYRELDGMNIL
jgi:hypothetical protein